MRRLSPSALAGFFAIALAPGTARAQAPPWWADRDIVPNPTANAGDNYRPANLGQAMNMATAAYAELSAVIPGGPSFSLGSFFPPAPANIDPADAHKYYAPVNIGQLKAIAQPFYDEIASLSTGWLADHYVDVGLTTLPTDPAEEPTVEDIWPNKYPWTGEATAEANYAPANIGQLKLTFALDFASDSDSDGLPDLFEYFIIRELGYGQLADVGPGDDHDGDGLTNAQELAAIGDGQQPPEDQNPVDRPVTHGPSLVGHWRLDEPAGGTAALDSSEYDRIGLASGSGALFDPAGGAVSGALEFGPGGGQLALPYSVFYKDSNPVATSTIALWVKTTQSGTTPILSARGAGDSLLLGIQSADGAIHVHTATASGGTTFAGSAGHGPINGGGWHHVAILREVGDSSTGTLEIFVDGVSRGAAQGLDLAEMAVLEGKLFAGADPLGGAPGVTFEGSLDDLRIYDRPLRAPEVRELAGDGETLGEGLDIDGDGLPDWWEREHFAGFQFTDGTSVPTPLFFSGDSDPDGDRYSNRLEYLAGTDPDEAPDRLMDFRFDDPPTSTSATNSASLGSTNPFSGLSPFGSQSPGVLGRAARFYADQENPILVAGGGGISGLTSITFSTWIKIPELSPGSRLFVFDGSDPVFATQVGLKIEPDGNGGHQISYSHLGSPHLWPVAGTDLDDGEWHHLLITVTDDASNDRVTLHIDGELHGDEATTATGIPQVVNFAIGNNQDAADAGGFLLDEFRVYGHALAQGDGNPQQRQVTVDVSGSGTPGRTVTRGEKSAAAPGADHVEVVHTYLQGGFLASVGGKSLPVTVARTLDIDGGRLCLNETASGRTIDTFLDAAGRVAERQVPGAAPAGGMAQWNYAYTPGGEDETVTVEDPDGVTTTTSYGSGILEAIQPAGRKALGFSSGSGGGGLRFEVTHGGRSLGVAGFSPAALRRTFDPLGDPGRRVTSTTSISGDRSKISAQGPGGLRGIATAENGLFDTAAISRGAKQLFSGHVAERRSDLAITRLDTTSSGIATETHFDAVHGTPSWIGTGTDQTIIGVTQKDGGTFDISVNRNTRTVEVENTNVAGGYEVSGSAVIDHKITVDIKPGGTVDTTLTTTPNGAETVVHEGEAGLPETKDYAEPTTAATVTYSPAGRPLTFTNGRGHTMTIARTPAGQGMLPSGTSWANVGGEYEDPGPTTTAWAGGEVTSKTDASGTVTFTRDPDRGYLASESYSSGALAGLSVARTLDASGQASQTDVFWSAGASAGGLPSEVVVDFVSPASRKALIQVPGSPPNDNREYVPAAGQPVELLWHSGPGPSGWWELRKDGALFGIRPGTGDPAGQYFGDAADPNAPANATNGEVVARVHAGVALASQSGNPEQIDVPNDLGVPVTAGGSRPGATSTGTAMPSWEYSYAAVGGTPAGRDGIGSLTMRDGDGDPVLSVELEYYPGGLSRSGKLKFRRTTFLMEDGAIAAQPATLQHELDYNPTRQAALLKINTAGQLTLPQHASGNQWTYTYDGGGSPAGMLIAATLTGGGAATYSYQYNGTGVETSLPHNAALNRVEGGGYGYDADGNRTSAPGFTFHWDALNRLRAVKTDGATPVLVAEYLYDSRGRRFQKNLFDAAGQLEKTILFVYDDWNLIYEKTTDSDGDLLRERKFAWGLDLSETPQGAGGVGGLMVITDTDYSGGPTPVTTHSFPVYDTTGNIIALVDAGTGAEGGNVVAQYAYDPFGNPVNDAGDADRQDDSPFRFSTKYLDDETGLYYYGYRYYDPTTGSWLSRDPLGEAGGLNLYGFVGNDPVNKVDYLGLDEINIDTALYEFGTNNIADSFEELPAMQRMLSAVNTWERGYNRGTVPGFDGFLGQRTNDKLRGNLTNALAHWGQVDVNSAEAQAFIGWYMYRESLRDQQKEARSQAILDLYNTPVRWMKNLGGPAMVQVGTDLTANRVLNMFGAQLNTGRGGGLESVPGGHQALAIGTELIGAGLLRNAGRLSRTSRGGPYIDNVPQAPGRTIDFVGDTGRLGGQLYDPKKLAQLEGYLGRRGVTLKVGDEFVPAGKAGGFAASPDGSATLFLRSNPTQYEVWHELGHFRHWRQLGAGDYLGLQRWSRANPVQDIPEQFVFDFLENAPKRWNALTFEQQQHAIRYIYRRGGIR